MKSLINIIRKIYDLANSKWAGLFFLVIGIISGALIFSAIITDYEQIKLLNKTINIGLILGCFSIYKHYFAGRKFDNEKEISKNPIAIAIDSGFVILAIAIGVIAG